MIRVMQEYRASKEHAADFEREWAVTGTFGSMFVKHGSESYRLLKDKREPRRYIVTHTWSDWDAFSRAQASAGQDSYDFQQRSGGWVESVQGLEGTTEQDAVLEDAGDRYEVLSERG